jgi:hypothetical protein
MRKVTCTFTGQHLTHSQKHFRRHTRATSPSRFAREGTDTASQATCREKELIKPSRFRFPASGCAGGPQTSMPYSRIGRIKEWMIRRFTTTLMRGDISTPHQACNAPKPIGSAAAMCVSQDQAQFECTPKYWTWSTTWREALPQRKSCLRMKSELATLAVHPRPSLAHNGDSHHSSASLWVYPSISASSCWPWASHWDVRACMHVCLHYACRRHASPQLGIRGPLCQPCLHLMHRLQGEGSPGCDGGPSAPGDGDCQRERSACV